jgi:phage nucleotide-binding protein
MPLQVSRVGKDKKPELNLLLYGIPGVGKTTFAAQAQDHPDLSPVLVADLEGGLLSVSGRGDIDAVEIRSSDDLTELFWALRNGTGDFGKYRTVIIDSGSNFANRVLQEWTATNKERERSRGRGSSDRTIDDVQLEDYGKMTLQVRRIMEYFRDLPLNVIVTALARFTYPAKADTRTSEPTEVGPDFTAKLSGNVTGMFDHVWYMYVDGEGTRHILTQERGVYRAKTRGGNFAPALGFIVDEPNLVDIYNLLIQTESSVDEAPDTGDAPDIPYLQDVGVPPEEDDV